MNAALKTFKTSEIAPQAYYFIGQQKQRICSQLEILPNDLGNYNYSNNYIPFFLGSGERGCIGGFC